jgi:anti-anti-sigma factor
MFTLKMKSIDGSAHCVQVSGRITQHAVAENKDAFTDILGSNAFSNQVILGFENVEHVDSSGVGWLLSNNRQFGEGGGKMVLHSLAPAVQNVFGMLKLNKVLTLVGSEDEAKQVAGGENNE